MIPSLQNLMQACWDRLAANRPTMPQVLTMLENIMIESQIYSPIGREFWAKNFVPKGVLHSM